MSSANPKDLTCQSFPDQTWRQSPVPLGQELVKNFMVVQNGKRFDFTGSKGNRNVRKSDTWKHLLSDLGSLATGGIDLAVGWNKQETAVRVTIVSPTDKPEETWAQLSPQIREVLIRHIVTSTQADA